MNITIFSEYGKDFRENEAIRAMHPKGLHETLKEIFSSVGHVTTVYQDDGDHCARFTEEILNNTDVLVWWGHSMHEDVPDSLAEKIAARVQCGMGVIFLHSAHMSKPFRRLMGTSCTLKWREVNERERLWVIDPVHPIARGVGEYVEIAHEEMYGESFDIPAPDETVFIGWYQGGEVFRSGVTYRRGRGKVFYFQPGHETNESYYNEKVRLILQNAAKWAAPPRRLPKNRPARACLRWKRFRRKSYEICGTAVFFKGVHSSKRSGKRAENHFRSGLRGRGIRRILQ